MVGLKLGILGASTRRNSGTHCESCAERVSHRGTEGIERLGLGQAENLRGVFTQIRPEARHTQEAVQPRLATEAKAKTGATCQRRLGEGIGVQVLPEGG